MFYVNAPSVIIGKHQNPFEEIAIQDRAAGGSAIEDLKSKFLGTRYAGMLSVLQKELCEN